MAPGHVAYGLGAQYGLRITAETVAAWERGLSLPTDYELTALAGVLWCAPGELLTAARTLREHRIAREVSPEELAGRLGMSASAYLRMEESGKWRGNEPPSPPPHEAPGARAAPVLAGPGREEG